MRIVRRSLRVGCVALASLVCVFWASAGPAHSPDTDRVGADEGTVTYSFFPSTYTPGSPVQVRLTANQYSWGTRVRLEDLFPVGWTASGATPPATQTGNKLVWDLPLVGSKAVTVSYNATPPAGASGIATFHHKVVFSNDSTSQQTDGDRLIAAAGGGCTLTCSAAASTAAGTAPLAVNFVGSASPSGCSGSVAYDWDFGDGTAHASVASPSHTYTTPGTFTWTMTATIGGVSCVRSGTVNVTAGCSLACTATVPSTASAGSSVAFQATATPANCTGTAAYDWDFGDGTAHASVASPSHTYTTPGAFTWTMTATIGGVSCTRSGTVNVTAGCSLACTATVPSTAPTGSSVAFQATTTPANCTGTAAYDWDFGDGSPHGSQQNPGHTYAAAGTFTWTLSTSIQGITCTRTGTITVTQSCLLTCSASAPSLAAVNTEVQFMGTAATPTGCSGTVAWDWDFGDGSSHKSGPSAAHIYRSVGTFEWVGVASMSGQRCGTAGTVTVSQAPSIGQAGSGRLLVDTSGHTAGAAGSLWVTDLVVHNPGTEPATANLYFLKAGQDNSAAAGRAVDVPPGTSLRLLDAVARAFGESSASGAILIGSSANLMVGSRTFSTATTGTYGQYVEGFPANRTIAGTTAARLLQLTRSTNYRTNIGFANATGANLPVLVDLYRADGSKIGTRTHTVKPFGYLQDNDVFNNVGAPSVEDGYAVVHSSAADASYLTYAAVIDNRTNDPVHIVPVRSSADAAGGAGAAPAVEPTWVSISNGLTELNVRAIACDPAHSGNLYAGTYGGGVFKTTDGGATWSPANTGLSTTIVKSLCVDPVNPTKLYAGTWDSGVFRSTDGGASWSPAASGLTSSDILHLVCDPFTSGTVYAGTNGKDVFKTTNSGSLWTPVATAMPFAEIEALAADPLTQGTLYAGNWYIYKTTSSGASWSKVYDSPSIYSIAVDPTNAQRIYAGRNSEIVKSTNGGASWSASSVSVSQARALAIDPLTPANVFVGGSYTSGVYRSTNGGASWTAMNTGLGNKNVTRLVFDPWTRTTLYAATEGGVFKVSFGSGCTFTLNRTSQEFTSSGGSGSFTVTASLPTCTWTATTAESWIAITSGASGTGNGTVAFNVAYALTGRTGTITAAGQAFAVTQIGACPCGAPDVPTLSAPSSAASGASYTLAWSATSPDNTYQVQESKDPAFAGTAITDVTGTSRVTSHSEPSGAATWYARVRTKRICGLCTVTSEWSNVTPTVVSPTCGAPAVPVLTAPPTATSASPYMISWTSTSPDGRYELQQSTDPAFAGAVIETITATSTTTSHVATSPVTWHARVRAVTTCNSQTYRSGWSASSQTVVSAAAPVGQAIYLPAAAHVAGAAGTNWKSDIEIHNPGQIQARFTLALLKKDFDNSAPAGATFTLDGGKAVRYGDVLAAPGVGFAFSGSGTLRVTPYAGEVMATMRTFNDQPAGTFGQFIPGQLQDAAIFTGHEARLIMLSHSGSATTGFRTNLGLVNLVGATTVVQIDLYRGDGTHLGTLPVQLKPFEHKQLDKIFTQVTASEVSEGYAVLKTTSQDGAFLAYASVIDNRSGDPIYIPARQVE